MWAYSVLFLFLGENYEYLRMFPIFHFLRFYIIIGGINPHNHTYEACLFSKKIINLKVKRRKYISQKDCCLLSLFNAIKNEIPVLPGSTGGDNTQIFVMNNYFGFGIEAELCLDFHNAREENPNKFNSR